MQQPVDLTIVGGRVVTPSGIRRMGIAVKDGRIAALADEAALPPSRDEINLDGKYLLPGIVDPEAHLGGASSLRQDIVTESRAAASAGVTTWGFQMASAAIRRTYKAEKTPEDVVPFSRVIPLLQELGNEYSSVDYFYTPMVTTDEQCLEIPRLAEEFGVTSFKLYLHTRQGASTFGHWPMQRSIGLFGMDDGVVYLAFEQTAQIGPPGIVSIHPENWEIARLFRDRLMADGRTDMAAWNEYSPHFCEAGHVRAYAYYAGLLGCPLYIQHTTTPMTVAEIKKARGDGVRVTAQTAAHYLTLPADTWKINTPLREAEVFPVLWQALRDGTIDTLGSDHMNRALPRAEMDKGNVWETISGFPSRVEMALPLMLSEGVNQGRISLERLVEVACENPARTFGIFPKKGAIQVGADADFVVVDLDKRTEARDERVYCGAGWTIIDGREIQGWPVMTILRGRVIARWNEEQQRNEVIADPDGKYIPRLVGHALYPLDEVSTTG